MELLALATQSLLLGRWYSVGTEADKGAAALCPCTDNRKQATSNKGKCDFMMWSMLRRSYCAVCKTVTQSVSGVTPPLCEGRR